MIGILFLRHHTKFAIFRARVLFIATVTIPTDICVDVTLVSQSVSCTSVISGWVE